MSDAKAAMEAMLDKKIERLEQVLDKATMQAVCNVKMIREQAKLAAVGKITNMVEHEPFDRTPTNSEELWAELRDYCERRRSQMPSVDNDDIFANIGHLESYLSLITWPVVSYLRLGNFDAVAICQMFDRVVGAQVASVMAHERARHE